MSCMFDIRPSSAAPVAYVDPFEAAYGALEDDIHSGRVVVDPGEGRGNLILFCTEATVTDMPSDILKKLSKAWFSVSFGPYDVETEDRVIEPANFWQERHPHLIA